MTILCPNECVPCPGDQPIINLSVEAPDVFGDPWGPATGLIPGDGVTGGDNGTIPGGGGSVPSGGSTSGSGGGVIVTNNDYGSAPRNLPKPRPKPRRRPDANSQNGSGGAGEDARRILQGCLSLLPVTDNAQTIWSCESSTHYVEVRNTAECTATLSYGPFSNPLWVWSTTFPTSMLPGESKFLAIQFTGNGLGTEWLSASAEGVLTYSTGGLVSDAISAGIDVTFVPCSNPDVDCSSMPLNEYNFGLHQYCPFSGHPNPTSSSYNIVLFAGDTIYLDFPTTDGLSWETVYPHTATGTEIHVMKLTLATPDCIDPPIFETLHGCVMKSDGSARYRLQANVHIELL